MPLLLLFQQVPDAVLAEDAPLQVPGQLAPLVGLVVQKPLAAEVVVRQLRGDLPRLLCPVVEGLHVFDAFDDVQIFFSFRRERRPRRSDRRKAAVRYLFEKFAHRGQIFRRNAGDGVPYGPFSIAQISPPGGGLVDSDEDVAVLVGLHGDILDDIHEGHADGENGPAEGQIDKAQHPLLQHKAVTAAPAQQQGGPEQPLFVDQDPVPGILALEVAGDQSGDALLLLQTLFLFQLVQLTLEGHIFVQVDAFFRKGLVHLGEFTSFVAHRDQTFLG